MHFNTFVLGYLCKSDAHRYFLHLIKTLPKEIQDLFSVDERSFDEIFHLTDERILHVYQVIQSMAETKNNLPDCNENLEIENCNEFIDFDSCSEPF